MPRLSAAAGGDRFKYVLLASIPLGFYGLAMQIEAGIFFIAAPFC
jgi:hypothetical protein